MNSSSVSSTLYELRVHHCSHSVITSLLGYAYQWRLVHMNAEAVLRWGARGLCPRFTCCLQIQKLADRSDVIFEVSKCSKILIFLGSARLPDSLTDGEGARCPHQEPHPALGPSGLVSTGLRVYNPLQSWQPY